MGFRDISAGTAGLEGYNEFLILPLTGQEIPVRSHQGSEAAAYIQDDHVARVPRWGCSWALAHVFGRRALGLLERFAWRRLGDAGRFDFCEGRIQRKPF